MRRIRVRLNKRGYDIIIGSNILKSLPFLIRRLGLGNDVVVITNPTVKRLLGERLKKILTSGGFNVRFETAPDSEKAKSEKHFLKILNNISGFDGTNRRILIIALGGGVIGDLAGFIASTYRRGVPYIQVPTTLLAQIDSAIGGKVAIDLKIGKNLAGAFYQPRLVLSDVSILKSLGQTDLISALAEVIKYGVIKSPGLFNFLEKNYRKILNYDRRSIEHVVYECSAIKAKVVEKDERDNKDLRIILNLGHTIGHAIEAASQYSKSYNHGQAIALGLLSSAFISNQLGILKKTDYIRIKELIKNAGLPTRLKGVKISAVVSAQEHDKKFIRGRNRFVLPVKIGKVVIRENIPVSLIKKSISILI